MSRMLLRTLMLVALGVLVFLAAPRQIALAANQVVNNCANDDELRADLTAMQGSGGGSLTFKCGAATIVLDSGSPLPDVVTNTTVDGGGKITLSGGNSTRIFYVAPGAELTLKNITLANGYANGDGGAIFNHGKLTVSSSKFLGNQTASAYSGGAIATYGPLNIDHSEFANNSAGSGGAIYPRFAPAVTTITNSDLHHNSTTNTTTGWGGAVLLWDGAPVSIEDSTVNDNQARMGGAVYVTRNSQLNVNHSMLNYNQATTAGGALCCYSGITLSSSTLAGNSTAGSGGAIFYSYDYGLSLTNVTLSNNSARFGGGIAAVKSTGTLTNVSIVGNSASYSGGGIDNGSYAYQGLTLKNTIIAYSGSGGNCHDINAKTIISAGFNLSSDTTCTEFFTQGSDKNNVDPLLGDLALNGGLTTTRLPAAGSPAINAGTGAGAPAFDQRGFTRPKGAAVDMGAAEVCETKPVKPMLVNPSNNQRVKAKVRFDWAVADCGVTYNLVVKLGSKTGAVVFSRTGIFDTELKVKLNKHTAYYWQVTAVSPLGKSKPAGGKFTTK